MEREAAKLEEERRRVVKNDGPAMLRQAATELEGLMPSDGFLGVQVGETATRGRLLDLSKRMREQAQQAEMHRQANTPTRRSRKKQA
jgi:hypothetical protein